MIIYKNERKSVSTLFSHRAIWYCNIKVGRNGYKCEHIVYSNMVLVVVCINKEQKYRG